MANGLELTVWQSRSSGPVVVRVAMAGDFLPAGDLRFRPGETWDDKAAALDPIFGDVDATFVNLESSIGAEGLAPRPLIGLGQIISAPPESLAYLKAIRSAAAGIANNHTYDFGDAGVCRTREFLRRARIAPIGSSWTTTDPPQIHVWEGAEGIRVGFWAAANVTLEPAGPFESGVEPATARRGAQALEEMKRRGAQFCVALLHAGCLRTNRADPEDVDLMEQLAHAGFSLVAASHSHRASGYKPVAGTNGTTAFCFHGLGSITSGYVASAEEREGLIVVAGLNRRAALASLEVRPVLLDADGFGSVPDALSSARILRRFCELSIELSDGTFAQKFYDEVAKDLGHVYLRDIRAAYRSGGWKALAKKARRVRMRHVRRLVHKVMGPRTAKPNVGMVLGIGDD
jgi:Bacterial capsule synthesis protein PGA_cap